jgi:hypothetical protein
MAPLGYNWIAVRLIALVLEWNPRITRVRPGATRLLEQMQKQFQLRR